MKTGPRAIEKLGLYAYLLKAYSKFLITGRALDYPLTIQLQTQSYCNAHCSICPYRVTSKTLRQGTMDRSLFESIVNQTVTAPLPSHYLFELHNEPLLDKHIFDSIGYIKSQNRKKHCTVISNGELIDRFSQADIERSGLDNLTISLNAHSKAVYDITNNGLDFNRVTNNIDTLLSHERLRHRLALSFVVTRQNEKDVYEAVKYWAARGVKTRVIKNIGNRTGALDNYDQLKLEKANRIKTFSLGPIEQLMQVARRIIGCHHPFFKMCILFNGDVIICCHDWGRATVVGNVSENTIKEIWNSEKMNKIRKLLLTNRKSQIEACSECRLT